MHQFIFTGRQKSVLLGFMILGLLCMGLTWAVDDPLHTRFWTNLLHNTVFFTGIAFIALFVYAAWMTAYSGWHTVVKRIFEGFSLYMVVGLVLMLIIAGGTWFDYHHLYHWAAHGIADPASDAYDKILAGKSSFLNKSWYTFGSVGFLAVWTFFAFRIRSLSIAEDSSGTADYAIHQKLKRVVAIFLPIAAFTSAAAIWQWVMSIDAHWYSTMFAWYATASWFIAMMSLTILTVIFLKGKGYLEEITPEHLHDLGKWLFAISIFWTYLWFSQFMLIWYANVGEETVYFQIRRDDYPVLFYGNLIVNFVLPFLILMRNDTKRKYGTLIFMSVLLLFGHWVDFFLMIKPGALHTATEAMTHMDLGSAVSEAAAHGHGHADDHGGGHGAHHAIPPGFKMPGLLEIGTFLGFLASFLFFSLNQFTKASLISKNDPYLAESLHHHT